MADRMKHPTPDPRPSGGAYVDGKLVHVTEDAAPQPDAEILARRKARETAREEK